MIMNCVLLAPDHSTQYLAENGFYMIGEIDNSQKIEFYGLIKKLT